MNTSLFVSVSNSLQETYEAKRNEFLGELQKKEDEMRQMFVMRVKEKEAELKEAEKDVSVLEPGGLCVRVLACLGQANDLLLMR